MTSSECWGGNVLPRGQSIRAFTHCWWHCERVSWYSTSVSVVIKASPSTPRVRLAELFAWMFDLLPCTDWCRNGWFEHSSAEGERFLCAQLQVYSTWFCDNHNQVVATFTSVEMWSPSAHPPRINLERSTFPWVSLFPAILYLHSTFWRQILHFFFFYCSAFIW